jgi:HAMP domain-containing protein
MAHVVDSRVLDQWSRMHLTLTSDRLRHLLDKIVDEARQCLASVDLDAPTAARLDEVARAARAVRDQVQELEHDLSARTA